jgi:putative holliday junction resolvase
MRLLGIDFGTKRIGLAVGDTEQKIAFPREVVANDEKTTGRIQELIASEKIEKIVLGISKNLSGEESDSTRAILAFKDELEKNISLEIILENEVMSTKAVYQGSTKREMIDAAAAALILQGYLDRVR